MEIATLVKEIEQKRSFLCVGLDTDIDRIPAHLRTLGDPVFEFNKAIIDATHDLAVAYKPNTAFYEALGVSGWASLKKTIDYLNTQHPNIFTIADAKRGDIGNTSTMYARAFFDQMNFDSVTVAPYMGSDSVEPFLAYKDRHTILLALTSNQGAFDFQTKHLADKQLELYKKVLETSKSWKNSRQLMYVVGATKAEYLAQIRQIIPDSFLLVPGVGAQGGDLAEVCRYGMNAEVGLLVNSSRGIIYAANGLDFAQVARSRALELKTQMQQILDAR
jgi:orotidine-5'-phosphate decarboxylase